MNALTKAEQLRQIIDALENLENDKKEIAIAITDKMAEAKAKGYDAKIIKQVLKIRAKSRAELTEEQALIDMYLVALNDLPLFGG
jgi:uncharacterized protein (UPF0335 family)